MAQALTASMAQNLDLADGYVVEWAAIDPTTGADVAGVVVSAVSIFGTALGTLSSPNVGNPLLIGATV